MGSVRCVSSWWAWIRLAKPPLCTLESSSPELGCEVPSEAGRSGQNATHGGLQCGETGVQEHRLHGLGPRWANQDPTDLATLLSAACLSRLAE